METEVLKIARELSMPELLNHKAINLAARLLRAGEVVAFPTETVYGLGGDALNDRAIKKIYEAKGRPVDNPLIVHIGWRRDLKRVVAGELCEACEKLISRFWPGPLTIIMYRNSQVPDITTAGLDTVAVRMPSHPITQALLRRSGLVLAAPSANASGLPSPTRASHVLLDLQDKIPLLLDGGETFIGLESTVIDLTQEKPVLLRPGQITGQQIAEVLGQEPRREFKVQESEKTGQEIDNAQPRSPGMKYRHYAPQTKTTLLSGGEAKEILALIKETEDKPIALLLTRETAEELRKLQQIKDEEVEILLNSNCLVRVMGPKANADLIAKKLFTLLRELDQEEITEIFVESIPAVGVGEAIMNRLVKAASRQLDLSSRQN